MTTMVQPAFDFTQDWLSCHLPAWERLVPLLAVKNKFLEIGSFEGRSACWFLQNALSDTGSLYCIDTWEGSREFIYLPEDSAVNSATRFCRNTSIAKKPWQRLEVLKGRSVSMLATLIAEGHGNSFDLIYVDGSHMAADVLTDACMAWQLLKPEGLMIFDDYVFNLPDSLENRPKLAIDAFTALFNRQVFTVLIGDQYVISKLAP